VTIRGKGDQMKFLNEMLGNFFKFFAKKNPKKIAKNLKVYFVCKFSSKI
jgi:hypothetical protein